MKLTKKEILDGNKLIAKFIGIEEVDKPNSSGKYRLTNSPIYKVSHSSHSVHLHFDVSWDWLMPVVEKIENETDYGFMIAGCVVIIKDISFDKKPYYKTLFTYADDSKIKTAWIAVLDLIKNKFLK